MQSIGSHIRQGRWAALLGLLAIAVAGLNALQSCNRQTDTYLNHAPGVAYVGNATCQGCHAEIHASFAQTGMGRSWYRPRKSEIIEQFGPASVVFDAATGYAYRPWWGTDSLYITEFRLGPAGDTTHTRTERVDYIVGSGHQTRSYILVRNGFFTEAPITWYVERQRWDLSPGYHDGHNSRFERPIGTECMGCHNGPVEHVPGTLNRYTQVSEGIACENCHGPGQVHVERMRKGQMVDVGRETDWSIVNPKRLAPEVQFQICMSCHLQGVQVQLDSRPWRPGMDLRNHLAIFLPQPPNPDAFGIASHAERLMQSRCYTQSSGQLVCTTCHDPHHSFKGNTVAHYRQVCQSCHTRDTCKLAMQQRITRNDNDCAACHLPKGGTSDIPHVRFSDHKIRVVPLAKLNDTAANNPSQAAAEAQALRLYCATHAQPEAAWLGKAYIARFEQFEAHPAYLDSARKLLPAGSGLPMARLQFFLGKYAAALAELEIALAQQPNDPFLLYRKGEALQASGQLKPAYAAYLQAWELQPALTEAGLAAVGLLLQLEATQPNTLPRAAAMLDKMLAIKPQDKTLLTNRGFIALNQRNFSLAEAYLRAALAQDPLHAPAQNNLETLLLARGQAR